jgi:hypothetical protein
MAATPLRVLPSSHISPFTAFSRAVPASRGRSTTIREIVPTETSSPLKDLATNTQRKIVRVGQCFEPGNVSSMIAEVLTDAIKRAYPIALKELLTVTDPEKSQEERLKTLVRISEDLYAMPLDLTQSITDPFDFHISNNSGIYMGLSSLLRSLSDDQWPAAAKALRIIAPLNAKQLFLSQHTHLSKERPAGLALHLLLSVIDNNIDAVDKEKNAIKAHLESFSHTSIFPLFREILRECVSVSYLACSDKEDISARWKQCKDCIAYHEINVRKAFKASRVFFTDSVVFEKKTDMKQYHLASSLKHERKYGNASSVLFFQAIVSGSTEAVNQLGALAMIAPLDRFAEHIVWSITQVLNSLMDAKTTPEVAAAGFAKEVEKFLINNNETFQVFDSNTFGHCFLADVGEREKFFFSRYSASNPCSVSFNDMQAVTVLEKMKSFDNTKFWMSLPFMFQQELGRSITKETITFLEHLSRDGAERINPILNYSRPEIQRMLTAYVKGSWEEWRTYTLTEDQIPELYMGDVLSDLEIILNEERLQKELIRYFSEMRI